MLPIAMQPTYNSLAGEATHLFANVRGLQDGSSLTALEKTAAYAFRFFVALPLITLCSLPECIAYLVVSPLILGEAILATLEHNGVCPETSTRRLSDLVAHITFPIFTLFYVLAGRLPPTNRVHNDRGYTRVNHLNDAIFEQNISLVKLFAPLVDRAARLKGLEDTNNSEIIKILLETEHLEIPENSEAFTLFEQLLEMASGGDVRAQPDVHGLTEGAQKFAEYISTHTPMLKNLARVGQYPYINSLLLGRHCPANGPLYDTSPMWSVGSAAESFAAVYRAIRIYRGLPVPYRPNRHRCVHREPFMYPAGMSLPDLLKYLSDDIVEELSNLFAEHTRAAKIVGPLLVGGFCLLSVPIWQVVFIIDCVVTLIFEALRLILVPFACCARHEINRMLCLNDNLEDALLRVAFAVFRLIVLPIDLICYSPPRLLLNAISHGVSTYRKSAFL